MSAIAFIDTEIDPDSKKLLDIGGIKDDGSRYHNPSVAGFMEFIKGSAFVCGHNILAHDLHFVGNSVLNAGIGQDYYIDTLLLSALLFPKNPYHKLVKDDKLQSDSLNNPLNDAIKARDLFYDEINSFYQLDAQMQAIFWGLLSKEARFTGFFNYLRVNSPLHYNNENPEALIRLKFGDLICAEATLNDFIEKSPVELAYALALIAVNDRYSITPPWVVKNFPRVDQLMYLLRSKPCLKGCGYCDKKWDIHKALKDIFGFTAFRRYEGRDLQKEAVQAAVGDKSLLAVFPTGGGKSITFQLPALMSGEAVKGLTVVIAPLQSLMKDQVDNLEGKNITEAVMINGLLDPIARSKAIERVENGSAALLYISPESLRSRTMQRLLLGRKIVRFVIDEAHCFSAWGQDFRIDYTYIGPFIRELQAQKGLSDPIPVSCFSATAKKNVIEDIKAYFKQHLNLEMLEFTASAARTNLHYSVIPIETETERYQKLRNLIYDGNCPTIVYVSRTKKAYDLAQRLVEDGVEARPYHGKMEVQEKTENQNAFLSGAVNVMVATSAFGMGVDKKDVGMVIHYEISDSLENYVQEAGRAGRDEDILASCYVLYNEEDLSQHLLLLNQTKLTIKEIQQVWKAIKDLTRLRAKVSNSALEIARKAGWEDNIKDVETRVNTAIASLENAGFLERGQNMPRVYASSMLVKNADEAVGRINQSNRFTPQQKEDGARIVRKLISSRSRKQVADEVPESRVDYISDHLGIVKEEVIRIVNLLREEGILADNKDLSVYIKKGEKQSRVLDILRTYGQLEQFLLQQFSDRSMPFHLKQLNAAAALTGIDGVNPGKIKVLLNYLSTSGWIKRRFAGGSPYHFEAECLQKVEVLQGKMEKRHALSRFILQFLFKRAGERESKVVEIAGNNAPESLVLFSEQELKNAYQQQLHLFDKEPVSNTEIEDALYYLSRIEAIKIEGGFMVSYNGLTIERLEKDNKKRFTKQDYQNLYLFYENRVQQIHIVGEYAQKMVEDYTAALNFTEDYFKLNYGAFLRKYFPGSKAEELSRKITHKKFQQLFGELSPAQHAIIQDQQSQYIVVAAGPGSGKTRILVHKMAALLLMEDIKHEQLLMLTFSRAAATELKKRLIQLVGAAAYYIDVKTFHAYAFDLLGKIGSVDESREVIIKTVQKIKDKEVDISRVTKTVMVIDEAQDMDQHEFALVEALMQQNEGMRVIAVGDDDQNIYGFRGASAEYMERLITEFGAKSYDLIENYRSKANLVDFTNQFAKTIFHRLKNNPIVAVDQDKGRLKVVHYANKNLIVPLADAVKSADLIGTTCVLTKTNDQALQVMGQLLMAGLPARFIQSNRAFKLPALAELRYFVELLGTTSDQKVIDHDTWKEAIRILKSSFQRSANLDLCLNLIRDFEQISPKSRYKSDLNLFIEESRLEDFYREKGELIYVSTIHKAKGKEFDQVFMLLEDAQLRTDEDRRALYVGMTRAKNYLNIHLNGDYLNGISAEGLQWVENQQQYLAPAEILVPLDMTQIYLGHSRKEQGSIGQLVSGDALTVVEGGCLNQKGIRVVQFSKEFTRFVEKQASQGFKVVRAEVNFIVHWWDKERENEYKVVLPNLYFEKKMIR
ncbi:RecQ family ATP-dependent DNA helicase [Arachidicoccus rhizosphaerae]|nr:RecQ family ATP-dependent DNA helicase [Arachidicoccus rhizosphaerae]